MTGATRGVLFQLIEALGLLPRHELAAQLPSADLKTLRRLGVRLGRETAWFPALASAAGLVGIALVHQGGPRARTPAAAPARQPDARSRLASEFYHAVGYRLAVHSPCVPMLSSGSPISPID